jgi:hypothetical protein
VTKAAGPSDPTTWDGSKERGQRPQEEIGEKKQWIAENFFKI